MILEGLPDHYGALGLQRSADLAAVKRSYRQQVLLWHPDRHPSEKELAETRIRAVNLAYEILGNPQRRAHYDQQLSALEGKSKGLNLDVRHVEPRMVIPKEFMLCPMGHPDRFLRSVGTALLVQSRDDTHVSHQDFFKDAKFSLWWRPQKNNMCHLRAQSSAGRGVRGGLNITFDLVDGQPGSEVLLSPIEAPQSYFIAVVSPEYQGAFRFESAYFPGHFIAFKPKMQLKISTLQAAADAIVDFILVDFAATARYMTLEEVLIPAVMRLGGQHQFVSIDALRGDPGVQSYFLNTLKSSMWPREEFEAYFQGHYQRWTLDTLQGKVRLRTCAERLLAIGDVAGRAGVATDLLAVLAKTTDDELRTLSPSHVEGVLARLAAGGADVPDLTAVFSRMLEAFPSIFASATLSELIRVHAQLIQLQSGTVAGCLEVGRRALAARAKQCIMGNAGSADAPPPSSLLSSLEELTKLLEMPVDWDSCAEELAAWAKSLAILPHLTLQELLAHLEASLKASARPLAEELAAHALRHLRDLATSCHSLDAKGIAAQVVESIASAGLHLREIPRVLVWLGPGMPLVTLANIIAILGEAQVDSDGFGECVALLAGQEQGFVTLSPSVLLRLLVVAVRLTSLDATVVDATVKAAASSLHLWTTDDIAKLLLALSKVRARVSDGSATALFERAREILIPKLPKLASAQLVKVVLAISRETACRELLEQAAGESVRNSSRAGEMPLQQLVLLAQGLIPLGADHAHLQSLFEVLATRLSKARSSSTAGDTCNADLIAKLLQSLLPLAPSHRVCGLAAAFLQSSDNLSAAGRAALEAAQKVVKLDTTGEASRRKSPRRSPRILRSSPAGRSRSRGRRRGRSRSREGSRGRGRRRS